MPVATRSSIKRVIKQRIVDWLLKQGFDQEQPRGNELRPAVEELVEEIGNQRFRNYVTNVETKIAELPKGAGEQQQARVMGRPLAFIVRNIISDAVEASGRPLEHAERDRLKKHVARYFDQPDALFSVLRWTVGAPRAGDEQVHDSFIRLIFKEESKTMADPVDLANFAFDTSSLPSEFEKAETQKLFEDTVEKALGKLGNSGPSYCAATIGLLLIEGQTDPESPAFFTYVQRLYTELSGSADPDHTVDLNGSDIYLPNNAQRIIVYQKAYESLEKIIDNGKIFYQDFARLGRKAADAFKRRPPDSPGFNNMIRTLFISGVTGDPTGDGSGGGIGRVELPPLNDPGGRNDEIEPDNIRAVSTIYVAFQLEQMRLFQATDRIVELFMAGLLPIGYDEGARKLDTYYWAGEDRLSEAERWSQYSRALGATGGQVSQDVNPNMEFNTLLLRFVSSVSEFERQQSIGNLFDERSGGARTLSLSGEYVRKAGRDLAANISLYGWAGTYFASERLARHVGKSMEILQLPQVREAYGVSTPWQVIERVSQREFGSAVNVVKHRTLAEETRKILNLIADKHAIWGLSSDRPLFSLQAGVQDPEDVIVQMLGKHRGEDLAALRHVPAINPTDKTDRDKVSEVLRAIEVAGAVFGGRLTTGVVPGTGAVPGDLSYQETQTLFRAVQYWLAVNGVQDATVDEYRQPTETIAAPSLPALGGNGAGAAGGGMNATGINELRDMVSQGQMPSMDQLRSLLPGT